MVEAIPPFFFSLGMALTLQRAMQPSISYMSNKLVWVSFYVREEVLSCPPDTMQ